VPGGGGGGSTPAGAAVTRRARAACLPARGPLAAPQPGPPPTTHHALNPKPHAAPRRRYSLPTFPHGPLQPPAAPSAYFPRLPQKRVLTLLTDVPEPWLVEPSQGGRRLRRLPSTFKRGRCDGVHLMAGSSVAWMPSTPPPARPTPSPTSTHPPPPPPTGRRLRL
jgi:hypothetical protein